MIERPEIKLVVTDIDDTLTVRHSHAISARVQDTIAGIQAAGKQVSIASARSALQAEKIVRDLKLAGPQVIDGGATVYDFDRGEVFWRQWIELDRLRQVAAIAIKYAHVIDCFPELRMLHADEFSMEQVVEDAPYVYIQISTGDKASLWGELASVENIHSTEIARDDDIIHVQISDERATKQHGVEKLAAVLGVMKEETLAIGDNQNDLPLFAAAGLKIAMGNATDELKRIADYTTGTVHDDGWADAMERFVL